MIRFLLALLVMALPANAQNLPALHAVTGVSADDMLNVRAKPNAGATIIGKLEPNATNIEVVAQTPDTKWGQINLGEVSGWVSLRYLRRTGSDSWPPQNLTCFGTEPFWTLTLEGNAARIETPEWARDYVITGQQSSANRADRFSLTATGLTATIAAAQCSDEMSDRVFGLSIEALADAPQTTHYSGCCTRAP